MSATIISQERLRLLAGEGPYQRAMENAQTYPVEDFSLEATKATGSIAGFRVKLDYHSETVEGACSCPQSDGFDFCEHCVQLALHANKLSQQMLSLSKGPDKSKVMAYLLSLEKQELAKQMLSLLEQDASEFKRYLLKASLDHPELDYADLRAELTQLTKVPKGLFSQRQVKHYFQPLESYFSELGEITQVEKPEAMLKLLEYAWQRLGKVLDQIDDRHRLSETAVERLRALYQHYFSMLDGRALTLAKRFEKQWLVDRHALLGINIFQYLQSREDVARAFVEMQFEAWKSKNESSDGWLQKKRARMLLEQSYLSISEADTLALELVLADSEDRYLSLSSEMQSLGLNEYAEQCLKKARACFTDSSALAKAQFVLYREQGASSQTLLALFKGMPLALYQSMLDYAEQSHQAVLNQVAVFLSETNSPDYHWILLYCLLRTNQHEIVKRSYKPEWLTSEQRIELADRIQTEDLAFSRELMQQEIRHLLGRDMLSADKKAARLLHRLAQQEGADPLLEQFVDSLKTRMHARPKFIECYRELSENHS